MSVQKHIIVAFIIFATMGLSYAVPRDKYTSPDVISSLEVPYKMIGWQGVNLGSNSKLTDERYNFISRIFSRRYTTPLGESLMFTILDAGNFHNPKVCLGGSGYASRDLPDTMIKAGNKTIKATTVYFEKDGEGYVVIYWISINKELVDWNKQKMLQLWYSVFNKKKVGLLVRFDIPCRKEYIPRATKLSQDFVADVYSHLSPEHAEYIFGK